MPRLGMITPSSNTVLEPITVAMAAELPDTTVHFSRFPVTHIALSAEALGQFERDKILGAAALLADAKVDVIAWNGTSASWLGFDSDEKLCAAIEAHTGIRACTAILALQDVLGRAKGPKLGLVTPYRDDVQEAIIANLRREGIDCIGERHLGLEDNFAFSTATEADIEAMIRAVVADGAEAVAIVCTNLRGAGVAARLERELGVPVYDSVALTIWKSLVVAGVDPSPLAAAWGRLFAMDLPVGSR